MVLSICWRKTHHLIVSPMYSYLSASGWTFVTGRRESFLRNWSCRMRRNKGIRREEFSSEVLTIDHVMHEWIVKATQKVSWNFLGILIGLKSGYQFFSEDHQNLYRLEHFWYHRASHRRCFFWWCRRLILQIWNAR